MKDLGPPQPVVCRLSVSEAKLSDTGSWTCELSNAAGKSTSTCSVKVIDIAGETTDTPPCFEQMLCNVTVTEYTDAVFRCKAVARPLPDVKWFRNDVPVDPSFRHDIKLDDEGYQTLTIKDAEPADAGIYKVKVSNTAGWASCDAKLYISSKHDDVAPLPVTQKSEYSLVDTIKGRRADQNMLNEADTLLNAMCDTDTFKKFLIKWKLNDQALGFIVHLRNKCVVESSQAVLSCLVNGIPPFKVRWYKDNKEIFDGGKYFLRGNLNILSLEMSVVDLDDTGQYMCVVRNDQGKIFSSCYLQVEPRLEKMSAEVPTKPFFTKPMKRQTVNEGDLIVFRVAAKAHPSPGFKWFKDGQELHDNARINTETLHHGVAQLSIHMATLTDIGLYVCEAHNHAGRARSMVRLSVRENYEMKGEAAKKPLEDIVVSTEGTSEINGQQNGDVKHTEPPYEPQTESGTFPKAPVITAALPKSVVIRDRGRFIIECFVPGFPKPNVKWSRNDVLLQENDQMQFLSLGDWYGLEVFEALPRHEGLYTIRLENSSGFVTSSCRVEMKLPKEEPKFFRTEEDILEGFFHKPQLQVLQTEFPWHQFDIPGLTPSFHLCNYEVDRTEHITQGSICLVDTLETPQFTKPLPDMVTPYESDTNLKLDCEVGGKPCPKVVWLKDDTNLQDSDSLSTSWDPATRTASLIFATVSLNDSGKYTCIAYSDVGGHAITSAVVQVRGLDYPDKDKESKRAHPEFKVRLEDKEAVPGQEVRLEVKTEGYPPPEVTWFKNSEPITAAIDKYSITSSVEGFHSLVIPDIHLSDSDCFKCEAKNDYGAVSTCAHVKVHENSDGQNDNTIRPYFEEPLHSISVKPGDDAVFKCSARGTPAPVFKWLKQGVTGIDQKRVKVEVSGGETTLVLKTVDHHDAGLYYCFANNKEGTVKSCASLTVLGSNGSTSDPSETNQPVEEGEKKNVTLFEEKSYTEAAAEEKKSQGAGDVIDSVKDIKENKTELSNDNGLLNRKLDSDKTVDESKLGTESGEVLKKEHIANESMNQTSDTNEILKQSQESTGADQKNQNSTAVNDIQEPEEIIDEKKVSSEIIIEKHESEDSGTEKSETDRQKSKNEQMTHIKTEQNSKEPESTDSIESLIKSNDTDVTENINDANVDQVEKATIGAKQEVSDVSMENSNRENESKTDNSNTVVPDNLEIKSRNIKVPKFITHPRSRWIALKSPLELTFAAEKCEDLAVAWYKEGELLKDDRFQLVWE